jgi:hypothetical protein
MKKMMVEIGFFVMSEHGNQDHKLGGNTVKRTKTVVRYHSFLKTGVT